MIVCITCAESETKWQIWENVFINGWQKIDIEDGVEVEVRSEEPPTRAEGSFCVKPLWSEIHRIALRLCLKFGLLKEAGSWGVFTLFHYSWFCLCLCLCSMFSFLFFNASRYFSQFRIIRWCCCCWCWCWTAGRKGWRCSPRWGHWAGRTRTPLYSSPPPAPPSPRPLQPVLASPTASECISTSSIMERFLDSQTDSSN